MYTDNTYTQTDRGNLLQSSLSYVGAPWENGWRCTGSLPAGAVHPGPLGAFRPPPGQELPSAGLPLLAEQHSLSAAHQSRQGLHSLGLHQWCVVEDPAGCTRHQVSEWMSWCPLHEGHPDVNNVTGPRACAGNGQAVTVHWLV